MARQRKLIEFITPREWEVPVDGQDIVVGPLRVHQIGEAAGYVDLVMGEITKAPPTALSAMMLGDAASPHEKTVLMAWLVDLIRRRHEDMVSLVEVALDHTVANVADWLPDRLVAILMLVIDVNRDFFSRAMPMLGELADGLDLPRPKVAETASRPDHAEPGVQMEPITLPPVMEASTGPAPSSSSSPTATDTPTS